MDFKSSRNQTEVKRSHDKSQNKSVLIERTLKFAKSQKANKK